MKPASFIFGLIALALLAGLAPIAWLGLQQQSQLFDAYTLRVLTFTLQQALLSTLLALLLGVPAALALARRRFPGRSMLISLLALPMALPQIVVVLGLIGLFGAEGWLAGTMPLYGLSGILLAHVFFNASLVARLTLTALQSIPVEQFRMAAQLQFSDLQHFRRVDWPILRLALPQIALLVFLLCAASFTIVLTLGGGPKATTLEAAIYLALRSDFDPARATGLAILQLLLCAVLALGLFKATNTIAPALQRLNTRRYDGTSLPSRLLDGMVLATLASLLLLPLATLVTQGLFNVSVTPLLLRALTTSLVFATLTATLSLAMAYALAHAAARDAAHAKAAQWASLAGLALPPAVMATGWFILAINTTGTTPIAPLLIIVLNALMALPYAFAILLPDMRNTAAQDRLAQSLSITGWYRFWTIDRRALARPLATAFAMGLVLALGDLAAILFFGDGRYVTLPSLIYQQMGSYRMQGAIGTALVLAALSWLILFATERGTRHA